MVYATSVFPDQYVPTVFDHYQTRVTVRIKFEHNQLPNIRTSYLLNFSRTRLTTKNTFEPGWPQQRHQTDDHSWSLGHGGSGGEEENKIHTRSKTFRSKSNSLTSVKICWTLTSNTFRENMTGCDHYPIQTQWEKDQGWKGEQNHKFRTFSSPASPLWRRKALKMLRQNG